MRATYEVLPEARGVIVTGVLPGTDAARRGFGPGDVIEQVNDDAVTSAADLQRGIDQLRAEKREFALVLVTRKNQPVTAAQLPGPKWITLRLSAS